MILFYILVQKYHIMAHGTEIPNRIFLFADLSYTTYSTSSAPADCIHIKMTYEHIFHLASFFQWISRVY